MEALGLGEFARVPRAHRVHVFWIVHAAELGGARRIGRDERGEKTETVVIVQRTWDACLAGEKMVLF
jgi:hypothetical protein